MRQAFGFGHGHGQQAPFMGRHQRALAEHGFQFLRRRVGQHLRGAQQEPQLAIAVLHQRVVRGLRHAGGKPGLRLLARVAARRLEGAFGDAQIQIGHDQLRDLRAHGGLRRGRLRGRLQHQLPRQGDAVEMHVAAVRLALAEGVPVRLHRHAILARGQGGDQRRLRGRMPGGDGQPVGTDGTGGKALDAVEDVAVVAVAGRDPLVEGVQGIAPEQALVDGEREQAALLLGAAIQLQARQLQMVEAEHVRQRAVGARQDADHLVDEGPGGALAAEFHGNRQGQQARFAQPFAFLRRMAARLVAGIGRYGQARGQLCCDADGVLQWFRCGRLWAGGMEKSARHG